jgi:hypothetical protein
MTWCTAFCMPVKAVRLARAVTHTGWENAKHWAAGGPKQHQVLYCASKKKKEYDQNHHYCHHPVYQALAVCAQLKAKLCVQAGVVGRRSRKHSIIATGGKSHSVRVERGAWDPFLFVDLLAAADNSDLELQRQLRYLQEMQLRLLLRYEQLKVHHGEKMNPTPDTTDWSRIVYLKNL